MPGQAYSQPLFDLFSFARRGLGRRDHLSPEEIQQVARTVRRTPEVMVKVLPKSANTLSAVSKHLDYIGRRGELDLEGDDGERLRDTRVGKHLVEEWDLDLDEYRRKSDLTGTRGREPARLVHKLIFSMPAGTPPEKVLTAVKNFAREEFGLKHRYLMALHTDQPHPHVHLVVKAMSEDGRRLNIRKTTLQAWRDKFARNLRMVGVAANATRRSYRGVTQSPLKDGIYRAALRGDSVYLREQAERAAANPNLERLDEKRVANHRDVIARAWRATAEVLVEQGHPGTSAASI
jgi:type IV secretory pathway VirD2 relaxase